MLLVHSLLLLKSLAHHTPFGLSTSEARAGPFVHLFIGSPTNQVITIVVLYLGCPVSLHCRGNTQWDIAKSTGPGVHQRSKFKHELNEGLTLSLTPLIYKERVVRPGLQIRARQVSGLRKTD